MQPGYQNRPTPDETIEGARLALSLGFQWLGLVYPFDDAGLCLCPKTDCHSPGKHPVGGPRAVYRSLNELWAAMAGFQGVPGLFAPTGAVNSVTVIDCDSHGDGDGVWEFEQWLAACDVVLPRGLRQRTPNGEHVFVQYVPELKAKTGLRGCIDIRNDGGLIVIAPSLHVSGQRYEFDVSGVGAPSLPAGFAEMLRSEKGRRVSSNGSNGLNGSGPGRDDATNAHAFQCKKLGMSEADALESVRDLWETFAQPPAASHPFTWPDAVEKVQNVYRNPEIQPEREHHPEWVASVARGERDTDEVYALADGQRPTDVGNANRLVAVADGHVRYVAEWGRWIVYDEGVWHIDSGNVRMNGWGKRVARKIFADAALLDDVGQRDEMWKWAKRSESSSLINSMVRLAADVPGVLISHNELDQYPYLFNVRNGTIDLKTGKLLDHNPEHLLTRQAPVIYDDKARAPVWERCLVEWQPDPEVRAYLQRVVGSAATGHPVEKFFINHGEGGNGKGKFFGALQAVMGPYAGIPHKSLLVAQTHQQHETVVADLFGVRMAVAAETEAGERLDEASIKSLTGGDPLKARRMREDRWMFKPGLTLFLHTNHRPRVRGSDEGVWRRVELIRWDVTIERKDEHLAAKLEAEGPGILNWLVTGARQWLSAGLGTPASVTAATKLYRDEEDHAGRFVADLPPGSRLGPTEFVSAAALRTAYEAWCTEVGEKPWSQRALGAELIKRGFERGKQGKANIKGWYGLSVAETATDLWRKSLPGGTYPQV